MIPEIFKKHNPLALKQAMEDDLLTFHRFFFKIQERIKFMINPHHVLIANVLHRVYNGEITRLIINIPPRYGKTILAVVGFVAWCFAKNKECRFLHCSYSDDLALENSSKIKDIIESEEFQYLWGLKIRPDSTAKKRWNIVNGGGLYAVSAGGQIIGFGAGKAGPGFNGALIIDDPIKAQDTYSDVKRIRVNDWMNDTINSRLEQQRKTPIIVIMQRLHEEDLSGFLLNGGNGDMWHHLCLPALIAA
jgi:hypothetical protein